MFRTAIKLAALLVLVSLGLWFFLFSPLFSDIQLNRSILQETNKEYEKKKSEVEDLRRLQARYKELDEEVKKVNEMLPSTKEYPKLLVEFPALVRASGMSYDGLDVGSPEQESKGRGIQEHEMRVSLQGGYSTFKNNFLYLQQRDLRLIDIEQISISTAETEDFDFSVTLKTYFQP